ncbi:MAG: hypothetical protein EOO19_13935 [Chryseobacterium sp.]|nr:MAG: hypothetical protein EOO19_13935 [Chryseobacterium sp.]
MKNSLQYFMLIVIAICVASCSKSNNHKNIILETKISKSKSQPTFLLYGELLPVGYTEEKDSVSTKKFGFNIKRVADCDVTSELIDSVKKINIESNAIMKSEYGNDWKEKFEKQTNIKIAIPEI